MKKYALSFLALILTAGTLTGCSLQNIFSQDVVTAETPALLAPVDVPVSTAEVMYRDLAITSYYQSTVVPYVEEYVFPISGNISATHYQIGDTVNAGDLLAELNHESIDKRIESLENRIESETSSITLLNEKYRLSIESLKDQRKTASAAKKAVIDCDIEIYETKIRQNTENLAAKLEPLQLELEELLEVYSNYFIYAPMPGQVVYAVASNSVGTKDTVIAVADLTTKYLQSASIDEGVIQSANRVYAIYKNETYDLRYIPYVYDSSSGRLANPGKRFTNFTLSDSTISDDIFSFGDQILIVIESNYMSNVLTVPNTALNSDGLGSYVYVVGKNGSKTRRDISIGNTNSLYTIVIDGLEEGELVYVPN